MHKLWLALLFTLLLSASVMAETVSVAWGAAVAGINPTLGYRIYYGTASANYSANVDAGNFLAGSVTGLTPGITYYFAVVAYSADGESGLSNEISKTVIATPVVNYRRHFTTSVPR